MRKTKIGQPVPQLPVKDVEKAQNYYKEILGFDVLWTYPDMSIGAVGRENLAIFFVKPTDQSNLIFIGSSQKMLT